MNKTKALILTGHCVALGIVLPMLFHGIQYGGQIFSPMHIPVLLAGLIAGPIFGTLAGLITPILSSVLTGMPPAALVPAMTVELALFGLCAGLLLQYLPIRKDEPRVYAALIGAMLVGRIAAGIVQALIFNFGTYSLQIWLTGYFVTSLPGIVLHIALIPPVYFTLKKAGLVATVD